MTRSKQKSDDDRFPDMEAIMRFERTVRRMVETPPKPRKLGRDSSGELGGTHRDSPARKDGGPIIGAS